MAKGPLTNSNLFKHIYIVMSHLKRKMFQMRRQRDDMQVNVAGLRRNIKNLAHNYSDAQVKYSFYYNKIGIINFNKSF